MILLRVQLKLEKDAENKLFQPLIDKYRGNH